MSGRQSSNQPGIVLTLRLLTPANTDNTLEIQTKVHPKVRNLNVRLGPRRKGHKGWAVWLA